jgi:hypothetical protein
MTTLYDGFDIESFEAGKGLWHARIMRADREPVVIDGLPFTALEVGFAWPDPEEAIAHAKDHIDRFKARYFGVSQLGQDMPRFDIEPAPRRCRLPR